MSYNIVVVSHRCPVSVLFFHRFLSKRHGFNKPKNGPTLYKVLTFNSCRFSFGAGFCWKYSARNVGKHCNVCEGQLCGVFCIIVFNNSLHHIPDCVSVPVPVMCIDRANVSTSARFSSSDSAETNVFGSLKKRDSCGCTSLLPRPVIKRKAVLSTLKRKSDSELSKSSWRRFHF